AARHALLARQDQAADRPRQGQEAVRQARRREGEGLEARAGRDHEKAGAGRLGCTHSCKTANRRIKADRAEAPRSDKEKEKPRPEMAGALYLVEPGGIE